MKIKAKNNKIASMRLCVPVDGIISIDHEGIADVSAKCAVQLVKGTNDWDYLKDSEADEEEDDKETEKSPREKFEEEISSMTIAQMKDYAKEAEFPEEEYSKLTTKKLMKAYLLKKYDEVSEADEEEDDEEEE